MMAILRGTLAAFAFLGLASPTFATPPQERARAAQDDDDSGDTSRAIVVEAIRREHRNIDKMIAPLPSVVEFKKLTEYSTFFARCVKHPNRDRLRAVIDGEPNTASYKLALDRFIRANAGCYPQYPYSPPPPPLLGVCNPRIVDRDWGRTTCMTRYDRGALLQQAIKRYVPDFSLSEDEVNDPAVQARLDAREIPRNRHRTEGDQIYFQAAICMVRLEPGLATQLVRAYGDAQFQSQIGQLILLRAKACVGNPEHVEVEPRQFAIYITDAAYRWEVAARNVDSLIPAES